MALPLAAQDTTLTVNDLKSRPYIDMTIGLLKISASTSNTTTTGSSSSKEANAVPTRYRIEGD